MLRDDSQMLQIDMRKGVERFNLLLGVGVEKAVGSKEEQPQCIALFQLTIIGARRQE